MVLFSLLIALPPRARRRRDGHFSRVLQAFGPSPRPAREERRRLRGPRGRARHHRPRSRDRPPPPRRQRQQADHRRAVHLRPHGQEPSPSRLPEAGHQEPHPARPLLPIRARGTGAASGSPAGPLPPGRSSAGLRADPPRGGPRRLEALGDPALARGLPAGSGPGRAGFREPLGRPRARQMGHGPAPAPGHGSGPVEAHPDGQRRRRLRPTGGAIPARSSAAWPRR
jgi:hypothetical protein